MRYVRDKFQKIKIGKIQAGDQPEKKEKVKKKQQIHTTQSTSSVHVAAGHKGSQKCLQRTLYYITSDAIASTKIKQGSAHEIALHA
jgi:hypothetical protein